MLLTEDRQRPNEHWTRQLPQMLRPLGVHAEVVSTGARAYELVKTRLFHAAVIDLDTPAGLPEDDANPALTTGDSGGGGLWLLEVLSRLPDHPPIVVVNPHAYSQRQVARLLQQALKLGAFSVVNRPVQPEGLLRTIADIVNRRYHGQWPTPE
ncbi:MAG: hypothetical protein AAF612_11815 [Planctomycetota bacterium]